MERLLFREWVVIVVVVGLIASLVAISCLTTVRQGKRLSQSIEQIHKALVIEVEIEGAVEYPGIYYYPPGVQLKEVLKEACLTKEADRKAVDSKKVLLHSEKFLIPHKKNRKKNLKQ